MKSFLHRWARHDAASHPSPFHYDDEVDDGEEEETEVEGADDEKG